MYFPPPDMGCNSTCNPYCPRRSVISGNVAPDIGYVLTIAPEYILIYLLLWKRLHAIRKLLIHAASVSLCVSY